jgi:proline racemase
VRRWERKDEVIAEERAHGGTTAACFAGYHRGLEGDGVIIAKTIDAHVAGAPLRLIADGFPTLRGATLEDKRLEAVQKGQALRHALLREPRGHRDMTAAVLTESSLPDAAAGVLFLTRDAVGVFRGHELIATVTIALERGLLVPRDEQAFAVETSAGLVQVEAAIAEEERRRRVRQVVYRAPPAFVARASLPIDLDGRPLRADIVWAAGWYAIVDREALGVPPESGFLDALRGAALRLMSRLEPRTREWPATAEGEQALAGVVLTGPPGRTDADLRSLVVYADGTVDRSPSGSATVAVLCVLDAMGIAEATTSVTHEGLSGLTLRAAVADRTTLDDRPAIVAAVAGEAWITGEHTFVLDDRDPLVQGFEIGTSG